MNVTTMHAMLVAADTRSELGGVAGVSMDGGDGHAMYWSGADGSGYGSGSDGSGSDGDGDGYGDGYGDGDGDGDGYGDGDGSV